MGNILEKLRAEIDELDAEFLSLLSKRISVVKKIGEVKKAKNTEIFDIKRQQEVLKKWRANAKKLNVSEDIAEKIYKLMHDYSLTIENNQK